MKNLNKVLFAVFMALILILPGVGRAATTEELQTMIQSLLAQVQQLQQQLAAQQDGSTAWCHTFNENLGIKSQGSEVTALNEALRQEGFMPPVEMRDFYSEETASRVTGFQEKYKNEILTPNGLANGTGYVGKSTRAKLNALYGCGVVQPPQACVQVTQPAQNPATGECRIFPTPCDVPTSWQKVSSCETSTQPSITIAYPMGGETFQVGGQITVSFSPVQLGEQYKIDLLMTQMGSSYTYNLGTIIGQAADMSKNALAIPSSVSAGKGYQVQITQLTNQGKCVNNICAQSISNPFNIVASTTTPIAPTIQVISPNGGEQWQVGQTYHITWSSSNMTDLINRSSGGDQAYIYLTNTNNTPTGGWNTIATITETAHFLSGSYDWTIPSTIPVANNYRIRIGLWGMPAQGMAEAVSNAPFNIVAAGTVSPKIVGVPAIPVTIQPGQVVSFSWSATDANNDNLSWSGSWGDGTGYTGTCPASAGANNYTATHSWAQPGIYTVQTSVYDCKNGSDRNSFTVNVGTTSTTTASTTPSISIQVLSPNGGEQWAVGSTHTVSWSRSGTFPATTQFMAILYKGNNSIYNFYKSDPDSTATSANWTIPSSLSIPPGNDYKVRVLSFNSNGAQSATDDSDVSFSIVAATASALDSMAAALNQIQQILNGISQ